MARTIKKGLEFFPMDVDFFQDIRIRKLIKYQGGKTITVYALLLCTIYRNGYYMEWDKELPFIISEQTGYDEAFIQEVIDCCMNIGLFSKEMFQSHRILTSKGIQERYRRICSNSRRAVAISEYSLLDQSKVASLSDTNARESDKIEKNVKKRTVRTTKTKSTSVAKSSADSCQMHSDASEKYSLSPEEEVASLKADKKWRERICGQYNIDSEQLDSLLDSFLLDCDKKHSSLLDASSHFNRWYCKKLEKHTGQSTKKKPASDPLARAKAEAVREKERREREVEFERRRKNAGSPEDFIRSKGYDPAYVSVAQVMNPEWCKANPPQSPP